MLTGGGTADVHPKIDGGTGPADEFSGLPLQTKWINWLTRSASWLWERCSRYVALTVALALTLGLHLAWYSQTPNRLFFPDGGSGHNLMWLLWLLPMLVAYQEIRLRRMTRQKNKGHELFRLISENAADMIALVDATGRRLYNSPAYQRVLGYTPAELEATSAFQQIHPEDQPKVRAAAEEARCTGVGRRLEYRIRHKNGSWLVVESTASAVRNQKGEVDKLIIVNRDITGRKQAEQKLEHTALHDALTDLPNRTLFLHRLQRAFERGRKNPGYGFAVLFVNIDGLKVVNDTMGHHAGDRLIMEISRRLIQCLRFDDIVAPLLGGEFGHLHATEDLLARMDGDDFMVLIGSIRDPGDVLRLAERIQRALRPPFVLQGREVFTSANIGIALSTTPHKRAEDMLRAAAIAVFRAKALGRSRCEVYDQEMHTRAVKQLDLEDDLRRAVEGEEFRLHYQSIVRLETAEIIGFEALVRWQPPSGDLVYPADFIGTAESTGLIVPMGRWVQREACRQAQVWQSRFPNTALYVTINVSPGQFANAELVDDLESIFAETGIDPARVHLEITESAAMSDPERARRVLTRLKRLGVLISIDDFGTGHSSLARLRRFPVDALKIDRSFIASMDSDTQTCAIVQLIIGFAHAVNLKVIAEGIETAAQWERLKDLGCEFGQGFFFSRPVGNAGVEQLLLAEGKHDTSAMPEREIQMSAHD